MADTLYNFWYSQNFILTDQCTVFFDTNRDISLIFHFTVQKVNGRPQLEWQELIFLPDDLLIIKILLRLFLKGYNDLAFRDLPEQSPYLLVKPLSIFVINKIVTIVKK